MKILHITSHLNIGGVTRYVLLLSQYFLRQNHRVIIASDGGQLESEVRAIGATHWRLPFHTSAEFSPKVFWGIRKLAHYLEKERVDILHAHTRVAQVAADRMSRRFGIPYVTTWHGIYKRRLGRRLWPCTGELTIAISNLVYQHLLHDFHLPERQVRLIYNGIDTAHYTSLPDPTAVEAFRKRWQIQPHRPVIGGIGRLTASRVKGFDILINAAHLLRERLPDLHVLIVGEGPRRPFLEEFAKRLGIQERVHFVGEVEDTRLPLAVMDLFVFTSRWPEAFGLTLVEAMAAGKPIVATSVGAVPEIMRHDREGWLVSTNDPSAIAQGILRLMNDRELATKLGRQAQKRAQEAFDIERLAVEIEEVYYDISQRGATKKR